MKAGVEFNEIPNKKAFMDAMKPVHTKYLSANPNLVPLVDLIKNTKLSNLDHPCFFPLRKYMSFIFKTKFKNCNFKALQKLTGSNRPNSLSPRR